MEDQYPPVQLPAKMAKWVHPRRYKIAKGGRGGGKSRAAAGILVRRGAREPIRWLFAREIQKSIEESVYVLLVDEIRRQKLTAHYDILKNRIIGKYTGATFTFTGLREHTKDSLKSYENYDGVWVEEAHSVSAQSWEVLIPTFRRDANPETGQAASEIWATYNPDDESDPIDVIVRDAIATNDPDFLITEINYLDNPWFPEVLEKERKRMLAQNPDLHEHIWLGKYRSALGIMFKREWFKRYDVLPAKRNRYIASDYAVTPDGGDSTEHGVWALDDEGRLYAEAWWHGQTAPDVWIEAWIQLIKTHKPILKAFEEKGAILRAVDGAINKAMKEANCYVVREGLPSATNKNIRALGFQARASAGLVYFPKTQWADRVIDQLCRFTGEAGKIDDAVDVCSLIGRALDEMHNASKPDKPAKEPAKVFTQEWFDKLYKQDEDSRQREEAHFK
jgi:predicted phage terminase large subunit-like protein